ncbi:MAG TPA: hypothetical protein VFQ91_12155 [Bryobacteraceae bacterium]|nr:hypothetical protein [Bryobacteraceae bacterium]
MESRLPLRPFSLFISLVTHVCLAAALLILPSGKEGEKPIKLVVYDTVKLQKAPIIYWARTTLPTISPDVRIGDSRLLKAEELNWRNRVVVKQTPSNPAKQVIWQPDKPQVLQSEPRLRNMVAVKGPVAPTVVERPPAVVIQTPPELDVSKTADLADMRAAVRIGEIPRRPAPFIPPPGKRTVSKSTGASPDLSAPPEIAKNGTGSALSVAVISLDPSSQVVALPDGSRQASFSGSPNVGSPSSGASRENDPVLPGISIAGSRPSSGAPSLAPRQPIANARTFEVAVPAAASTTSVPLRPSSRNLPSEIESRFTNRIVYTLVVAKPDLPEYSSDWTIWFAERGQSSAATGAVRAPVPIRKTMKDDRRSAASAAGIRVRVSAVVGKDGRVSAVVPVLGKDSIAAARAAEDLENWQFRAAQRNGESIEVDLVVEFSYRVQ